MSYEADDLKPERIEQLRHLAQVAKVEGMLIQEWEIVALCTLAERSMRLKDAIDCACNALTDSICVSGNDADTNIQWVRKLRAHIQ